MLILKKWKNNKFKEIFFKGFADYEALANIYQKKEMLHIFT